METEAANPQLPLPPIEPTATTLVKLQQQDEVEEEEGDDIPTLSPFALAALQDYLFSQSLQIQPKQQQDATGNADVNANVMPLLKEDWRLSQFWYSPNTATTLANEISTLIHNCTDWDADTNKPPSVACISCPTLFIYLKMGEDSYQ